MKVKTMQDLFEHLLRKAYDCEKKLVKKGLPSMVDAASAPELKTALQQHLQETQMQVARLEQVFSIVGKSPDTEKAKVLDQMTDEAEDVISDIDPSPLRDAALIVSGNQVEHFEIAIYGSLVSFARQLGFTEAATLLEGTLNEEKAADAKLTQIAEQFVNVRATQLRAA
jgi:ferritin-like metal-binding protein YciE